MWDSDELDLGEPASRGICQYTRPGAGGQAGWAQTQAGCGRSVPALCRLSSPRGAALGQAAAQSETLSTRCLPRELSFRRFGAEDSLFGWTSVSARILTSSRRLWGA